ncbi:MAG: GNAT family N-acetyltransferase [Prevotella sp.]|nr:GNAT family N-acetyltransferase [Staphylococcus sp.]MCM1349606.1 GNAT family N-acetyltransferase [Prevotella sp.]
MELYTRRLILRPWKDTDAKNLYHYAKDPMVGPIAGWPPHKSVEDSLRVIQHVLNGKECYAVCLKESGLAIGAIELILAENARMTSQNDECELGYWIGRDFWGQGMIPEAAREILRHAFEDLHMSVVWCGYYEGNEKSKRVQEKVGFVYHHTCYEVLVPLMNETRIEHINCMTKEHWSVITSNTGVRMERQNKKN